MWVQAPLCLLFLGPSAKSGPGLLGVATLQLRIQEADPNANDSCRNRVQLLPLISPAGDEIGCMVAAARIVDCLSPISKPELLRLVADSQDDFPMASPKLPDARHDQEAKSAAQLTDSSLAPAGADEVSTVVQTDTPKTFTHSDPANDSSTDSQSGQASVGVQVNKGAYGEQDAMCTQAAVVVPYVIQSPHFHIYAPGPPPANSIHQAHQPAAEAAPVINISQPTFHMHPPLLPHMIADQSQLQASAPVPATQSTADAERVLQPAVAAAAQEAGVSDEFDSWCPMTATPHPCGSVCMVAADSHASVSKQPRGTVSAGALEGYNRQTCNGAHAAQQKQCRHHQVCLHMHDSAAMLVHARGTMGALHGPFCPL